ncbi:MAG: SMC family ATPase [Vulcanisaeta sp.]|nr:SMC family ATPase [Vulcanisaeta sp.]
MITRVEVENFRSIVKGRAVITEGVNFVHGPNGAGKTSLLEAIAIALYGSDWVRGRYRLSDLVRRGASSSVIRLEYVGIDGRRYLVQRVFNTEKTLETQTYVIDESGRRVAVRDREVTQFVIKTTGVSMEVFSELLYVRQGEIRDILRVGKRGEFRLDELLRLDAIERARQDVIREAIKSVSAAMENLRGKLEILERELSVRREELGRLEVELNGAVRELERREAGLRDIEAKLSELVSKEEELKKLEKEYLELRARLESLTNEESSLRAELDRLSRAIEEVRGLEGRVKELESLIARDGEVRRRIDELARRRDELRGRLTLARELRRRAEAISRELDSVNKALNDLNNELERMGNLRLRAEELRKLLSRRVAIETELNNARTELGRVNAEIEHLRAELSLLRDGGGKCPLCGRPLTADMARELVVSREARLRELSRRAQELADRVSRLSSELEALAGVEEELRVLEAELGKEGLIRSSIEDLRRRREALLAELNQAVGIDEEAVMRELTNVEAELARLSSELEAINRAKVELAEIRGKIASMGGLEARAREVEERLRIVVKARAEVEARVRELEGRVAELVRVRELIEELRARRDAALKEVSELRGRVDALRSRIERLRSEVSGKAEEVAKLRGELGRYVNAVDVLNKLQQALDDAKPIIRRLFLNSINEELNSMMRDLMHKISYASVEVGENYEVVVRRVDGVSLPVESLSIGERNLVSLMLRYAIARVIMGFIPIFILDEPTEHLDEEHRRRIASWIRSLSNGVRTVIITSHVDALETIADNVIRVGFINDKGESMFSNA